MDNVDQAFAAATGEIERILNTKTIVGEPIVVDGATMIPLMSVGFGFGYGTGQGADPKRGQGGGTGVGGGGGMRPVAVLIIDKAGVRLEPLKGGAAGVLEKVAAGIGQAMGARREEKAVS
ncbi:MAG TPA: spore germination protein GerW family protein [Polyangia bacterium]